MKSVDINCDMGESFGNYQIGNDQAIFPYITSCNIACGAHAGDPYQIEKTLQLALEHNVRVGAHPGYPDLLGFGRRVIPMPLDELSSSIKYQVSALKGMIDSKGGQLAYVKPHGALYNEIAQNKAVAQTVYKAILDVDSSLAIMGLAGSHVKEILEDLGATFIPEAFADRVYEANGKLRSRTLPDAVIGSPDQAAEQVVAIAKNQNVKTYTGEVIDLDANSFCIHGDNPMAVDILEAIDQALERENIAKKAG